MISYQVSMRNYGAETYRLEDVQGQKLDDFWAIRRIGTQRKDRQWVLDHPLTGCKVASFKFKRQAVRVGQEMTAQFGEALRSSDLAVVSKLVAGGSVLAKWVGRVVWGDERRTFAQFEAETVKAT